MDPSDQAPELPLPQCTLTSELLRLRGGPYHTLSYARLSASVEVLNGRAPSKMPWLAVDHDCDGVVLSELSDHRDARPRQRRIVAYA